MNQAQETEPAREMDAAPFWSDPKKSLWVLGIGAGLTGLAMIQFYPIDLILWSIAVVFLLMGIPLSAGWAIYLLLGLMFTLRFVFYRNAIGQSTVLWWHDLNFALLVVGFAALSFRYLELSKFFNAYGSVASRRKRDGETQVSSQYHQFPSILGGRWWLVPVAVAASVFLLELIPVDPGASRRLRITPTGNRLITLSFVLFFCWFVSRSLLALAIRWSIKPEQAEIQVRSAIADETWNEQVGIESRRRKYLIRNRGAGS